LNNAPLSDSSKNPIILPSKHHFIDLIVKDVHEEAYHNGINTTLSRISERYRIIRGRETVKRNLNSCVLCKKIEGVAYKPRNISDLPESRVSEDPPFSHSGVDFAGPLLLKSREQNAEPRDHLQSLRLPVHLRLDASNTFGINNKFERRSFLYGISSIRCEKRTALDHYVRHLKVRLKRFNDSHGLVFCVII
jgi:hypothetical protein